MIDLINISLQFNGKYLFKDLNYKISSGDRISLVGANGTGKSSLLKIINGDLLPEEGVVKKQKNISIGYLPQELMYHSNKPLLQEALSAINDLVLLQNKETELQKKLEENNLDEDIKNDLLNQLGEVQHKLVDIDSCSAPSKVEKILLGLGFSLDDFIKPTASFSCGWQMRIALAKLLISHNDILLLDEPTNHLDLDSLNWLISFLKSYKGALIIVSHDINFVSQLTNKTIEIYLNRVFTFKGNYDAYLKYKAERDTQLLHNFEIQQKKIQETQKFIERFRYKATKARQVQSRIKQIEKLELIEIPNNKENIKIKFPSPPKSGRIPLELINITKCFNDKIILNRVDLVIERNDKIALVGPNGAGKTTLAKIIAGQLDFDSGKRLIPPNTIISYYAQDVADSLDPSLDIFDTVSLSDDKKTPSDLRTLLGCFLFSGDDVFKPISVLSGGEKSRVALCKILLTRANLIILDEPTNHLDMDSKKVLQHALSDFEGSLVIVSHDVDFLRPIVNKIIDVRNQKIKIYMGGIDYYLEKFNSENSELILYNKKNINSDSISKNKKYQKRIEAEKRNKKHQATKLLNTEIGLIENRISELEIEQKDLLNKLNDTSIYSDGLQIKNINTRLKELNNQINQYLAKWEILNEELNDILKQFD